MTNESLGYTGGGQHGNAARGDKVAVA